MNSDKKVDDTNTFLGHTVEWLWEEPNYQELSTWSWTSSNSLTYNECLQIHILFIQAAFSLSFTFLHSFAYTSWPSSLHDYPGIIIYIFFLHFLILIWQLPCTGEDEPPNGVHSHLVPTNYYIVNKWFIFFFLKIITNYKLPLLSYPNDLSTLATFLLLPELEYSFELKPTRWSVTSP